MRLVLLNLRHILQGIHIKSGKGIMLPVDGPAAVDTRESCRQVHQVKGSVSGDVISDSLVQPEILCLLIFVCIFFKFWLV